MNKVSIWSSSNLIYKNKKAESFTFFKKMFWFLGNTFKVFCFLQTKDNNISLSIIHGST